MCPCQVVALICASNVDDDVMLSVDTDMCVKHSCCSQPVLTLICASNVDVLSMPSDGADMCVKHDDVSVPVLTLICASNVGGVSMPSVQTYLNMLAGAGIGGGMKHTRMEKYIAP